MTIDEAIEVLELHNKWRKGAEIPQESPVRIGMAIDLVVCELKNLNKAHVISSLPLFKCKCGYETSHSFEWTVHADCCSGN